MVPPGRTLPELALRRAGFLTLLLVNAGQAPGAGTTAGGDPSAVIAPEVVREAAAERFPGFLTWSIRTMGATGGTVHEVILFDPRSTGLQGKDTEDGHLLTRPSHRMLVSGSGEVLMEERHRLPEVAVPAKALATFADWRTGRPGGMAVVWAAYQEAHGERRYVASIVVNAIESHTLVTNRDGEIIDETTLKPE